MAANRERSRVKDSLPATVVVLLLSLGTWVFFYLVSVPLVARDTAVVVGIWLTVVFCAKWLLKRMKRRRDHKSN